MISSLSSIPTDNLTKSGVIPPAICSSSDNCECVVVAGWIARLFASPTLARWLKSSKESINFLPDSLPPFIPKTTKGPPFPRKYFLFNSYSESFSSPGNLTQSTDLWLDKYSANFRLF